MKKSNLKRFGLFLSGAVLGVALTLSPIAEASTNALKFIVNGVDQTPANGKYNNNGTIVDASILQNGTTYIPVRMVSDMLGVPIEWEANTRSVLIGDKSLVDTTDLLGLSATEIIKSNRYDRVDIDNHIRINGKNHRGLAMYSAGGETLSVKYNLNRAYKEFSTTLWADQTVYVMIVGDGVPLWQGHILSNSNPVDVKISTKNVSNLEFRIEDKTGFSRTAYFVNPLLSK